MIIRNETLLDEFRSASRCEDCGKRSELDAAHLFPRGLGGGFRVDVRANLLGLCRACHATSHARGYGEYDPNLLHIIARREDEEPEDIVAVIRVLRNRIIKPLGVEEIYRGLAILETEAQRQLAVRQLQESGCLP